MIDGSILLVFESWNGLDFENNEGIKTATSSFTGLADTVGGAESFQQQYTLMVDCNSASLTTVYDYLAAKMAEYPIDAIYASGIVWGKDEQSQFMYVGADGYYTNRVVDRQEGVWLANRGVGTIAYFTSDAGTQYIPPVQYSFTLTGLKPSSEV